MEGPIMTEMFDRLPPHNRDAERGVLGSILLDADRSYAAVDEVTEIGLRAEDFYSEANQRLFRAMVALHQESRPCDPVTVGERLEAAGELAEAGGPAYLVELIESVPHVAHAKYYAEIVREKAARRGVIYATTEALRKSYEDQTVGTDELIATLDSRLMELLEETHGSAAVDMLTAMTDLDAFLESGRPHGIPIGMGRLQELLAGWCRGAMYILAARPSMGKTALALNLARLCAMMDDHQNGVLIFSIEQGLLEVAERMASIDSGVSCHLIRSGDLSGAYTSLDSDRQNSRNRIIEASNHLSQLPLLIDDKASSISQIEARVRTAARKRGVKLVIVDYLQLVEFDDRRITNREQQVGSIAARLKLMAKSLGISVIALAQLNRQIETRTDKRPQLADLRESGAIEQHADVVMFVDRPIMYDEQAHPNFAKLYIRKNRHGAVGDIELVWTGSCMRFEQAEPYSFAGNDGAALDGGF